MPEARDARHTGHHRTTRSLTILAVVIVTLTVALLLLRNRSESVRQIERQHAFERVVAKEQEVNEARALLARRLRELEAARALAESLDVRAHSMSDTARPDR